MLAQTNIVFTSILFQKEKKIPVTVLDPQFDTLVQQFEEALGGS